MYLSLELLVGGVLMICTTATATTCTSEGYVLKEEVRYVPKNRMEYEEVAKTLQCVPTSLKLTFLIETWKNGTIVGCYCDIKIFRYCAELNRGSKYRVQANYGAPCDTFTITPCPDPYDSSKSYLVWQCFVEYGNILSPWELAIENENIQRTIKDLKKDFQNQHDQILKCENTTQQLNMTNMELASDFLDKRNLTERQNMTINELRNKLNEMIQNKEQCISTGVVVVFCLIILMSVVILGNLVLFFMQKYKNKDITFHDFCHWRLLLLKCWLLTSYQTQLQQYCNTQESNSDKKIVDGSNGASRNVSISIDDPTQSVEDAGSRENLDAIDAKNEIERVNKAEKEHVTNYDHGDDEELSTENEAFLKKMDTNDVKPEKMNGENIVNLQSSTKINKMVLKTEEKSRVYSKDRKQKETLNSNINNMEEVDKAEAPVVNTYE